MRLIRPIFLMLLPYCLLLAATATSKLDLLPLAIWSAASLIAGISEGRCHASKRKH